MNKSYRIYYCKPDEKGGFVETTADTATVFRLFSTGTDPEHIKDFFPLSEANKWIAAQRTAQGNSKVNA